MTGVSDSDISHLKQEVSTWVERPPDCGGDCKVVLLLGVDIGGTHVRFQFRLSHCIHDAKSTSSLSTSLFRFRCSRISVLKESLQKVEGAVRSCGLRNVDSTAICVAGPIKNGSVAVTNYEASDRQLNIAELPHSLFPPLHSELLNDLESACFGVLNLSDRHILTDFLSPFWRQYGGEEPHRLSILPPTNVLVAAVGTGLGVACLQWNRQARRHIVLPMEFGHVQVPEASLSAVYREEEMSLFMALRKKLYGKLGHPIEYEDVVSGRGLVWTYQFFSGIDRPMLAGDVATLCTQNDSHAIHAVVVHYRLLMRCLKNLCVGLQCGAVLLLGDNLLMNKMLLLKHQEELRSEFFDHSKLEWYKGVEIHSQSSSLNLNVEGALYSAHHDAICSLF